MAHGLPRTIKNPLDGERVTFLATAEETGGEYVRVRNEVSAGAQGPPMHYHLAYIETFEVVEGTLDACVGDAENHLALAAGGTEPDRQGGHRPGGHDRRACHGAVAVDGGRGGDVDQHGADTQHRVPDEAGRELFAGVLRPGLRPEAAPGRQLDDPRVDGRARHDAAERGRGETPRYR